MHQTEKDGSEVRNKMTTFRLKFNHTEFTQKTLTINDSYMNEPAEQRQLQKLLIKQFLNEYVWKKGDKYAYQFKVKGKTIYVEIGLLIGPETK